MESSGGHGFLGLPRIPAGTCFIASGTWGIDNLSEVWLQVFPVGRQLPEAAASTSGKARCSDVHVPCLAARWYIFYMFLIFFTHFPVPGDVYVMRHIPYEAVSLAEAQKRQCLDGAMQRKASESS